jgi:hypothetical protein
MPAMALDVSGNWVAGDDLRIIEALGVPFGSFTLTCVQDCANQLEGMSAQAVLNVRGLLDEYEAAKAAESAANLADSEGKTLVKADVLEWSSDPTGTPSGAQKEMMRAQDEIGKYFAFCSCLYGLMGDQSGGTSLIRS